jgi:TolB-like protein/Tfp pilus assembly protein PilF
MPEIPDNIRAELGDHYDFERELVGGGMARVFLAVDRELHRRVVIKVLPQELALGVSAKRFRSEILTVAKLQHPHIVGILRAGEVEGVPYFVMPYVEGESLAAHLRRSGPSSVRDAVAVFRDVARALAFAHSNGILHRDIKPGNILLASGSATVTDFGVAKALSSSLVHSQREGRDGRNGRITDTGVSLGTLLYMAPEQAANDPHIDGRADIYSLGITIYEMLAGEPPFAGLPPREMLTARLTQRPPLLSTIRQDIPSGLESLIVRCLEADPANRPADAPEVVEWLESSDVTSGPTSVMARGLGPRGGRRRVAALAGGAVLVALVALGAFAKFRGGSDKPPPMVAKTAGTAPTEEVEVIAILPFVSIGATTGNSYLAEGLTNALAGRLSRAAGLNVVTPSRAVAFVNASNAKGAANDRTVLVLEGAVEKNGNTIRVSARLSDAQTGIMRWADVFDRDISNLLAVEDEIAEKIVEAVAPRTTPKLDSFNRATPSLTPELYERYLRAKYDLAQRGPAAIRRAIQSLQAITKQQPLFAPAFASLSQAYTVLPLYTPSAGDSLRRLALYAANKSVSLDSTLADAYTARALAHDAGWSWSAAARDFQRALAIDSLSAKAHQWYGEHLLVVGNPNAAVRELITATRLDPTSAIMAGSLAVALVHVGRGSDAVRQAQTAAAMDPSFATTHMMYGAVLIYSGNPKRALVPLGEALQLSPDSRTALGLLGLAYAAAGDIQMAQSTLRRLEQAPTGLGGEPAIARIKVGMGDVDGGFAALQRAVKLHDPFFVSEPLTSPPFGRLKNDPRFAALARELGLLPQLSAPTAAASRLLRVFHQISSGSGQRLTGNG